ncbi:MAG: hypothetical protein JWO38_2098 [Gemmataceae bacterium]|nr:hypothetical protein [Gemmataceae bacterium]
MSTATTPEMAEARELIDRAMKLSPAVRESIALELLHSVAPSPGHPGSDWAYWKAEIARRIEAVENGTMKTYTLEETLDYIQSVLDEDQKP